ncbi:hypothetical protein L226DRAFT_563206 [Lentinus tigrinus ALCF2SS1-7]|uniref:Uncharacterized protein n=1 Tax=Lentinus tigrinus ALCF2SS1-6 TaxID=1328759 RepID=A0A5C2RUL9_9APHY|nr:hypothetical protein L227DRAFT_566909 [Lentinus tigrinus ALCF2SS1-6]RPD69717.1 hypothetical protein L226DRAFT_563206 [Lentinus tigrinus ALCF2SS1-7]
MSRGLAFVEKMEGRRNIFTYAFSHPRTPHHPGQPMQREDTQALLSAYLSILERKEEKKRKEKPSRKDEGLRINVIEQCLQYHSNGEQIPRTPPSGYERDIVVRPCGTPGTRPTPPPQLLPPAGPYQYEINDPDGEFLDLRWEECTADVFLGATAAQKGFTLQASEKKRSSFDRLSETCSVVHNIRTPLRRVVTAVTDPHAIEYWVYLARVEGERIEARAEARARVEAERLQAVAESQFNGETSDDEQEDYQDEAEDNAEEGKAEEIFDFLLVALQESAENEQIDGESGEEFDGICHGEELEWDSDSDSDWDSGKLDVPDDVESG